MPTKLLTAKHPNGEYPIYFGEDLLHNPDLLHRHIRASQVMIVTNDTIAKLYLDTVQHALSNYRCEAVVLPDGEQYKTLSHVNLIWETLAKLQYHRDASLIALGGGVIGDMTGFAAACYHRGIHFIQIPTTLLAQCDSSIGGKTAVDSPYGKNLIGAFHQPAAVIVDVSTLTTLPDREFRAGLSEIIKAALIKDAVFFKWLEKHLSKILTREANTLIEMLERACQIKTDIVEADEKERGIRALLNLGHTFGHAIEHCLDYKGWLHGEAVALGILMAAALSLSKGQLTEKEQTRIQNIFTQIQMPHRLPSEIKCDTLHAAMWSDKKIINNQLHLILLNGIGHAEVTTQVSEKEVLELLHRYK